MSVTIVSPYDHVRSKVQVELATREALRFGTQVKGLGTIEALMSQINRNAIDSNFWTQVQAHQGKTLGGGACKFYVALDKKPCEGTVVTSATDVCAATPAESNKDKIQVLVDVNKARSMAEKVSPALLRCEDKTRLEHFADLD